MKHCDTCLTNVEGLCPHCRMCASCCDENKCFGCGDIFKNLKSILPKKLGKKLDDIEKKIMQENIDS